MDTYLALTQPDASDWSESMRGYARNLRMFSVRQPLPLLLAGRRRLEEAEFEKLLRAIVMISFRYNVIGNLQTSVQERTFHAEAERIAGGQHGELAEILERLRSVYPSDDQFRSTFAEKAISVKQTRNRRIARYVLCALERQTSGTVVDFDCSKATLEHICPINPQDGWEHFTDEELDALTSRLGNMVLLEESYNRDLGNAEYDVKRTAYGRSAYESTRNVAESYDEWTPDRLHVRQSSMARMAIGIWRVTQLN